MLTPFPFYPALFKGMVVVFPNGAGHIGVLRLDAPAVENGVLILILDDDWMRCVV